MSDAFKYVVCQPFDGHEIGSILTADDLTWSHGAGAGEEAFAHRVGSHLIRVAALAEEAPTATAEPTKEG